MGRACITMCRQPSMCSPLATTETATMRRVFVVLARVFVVLAAQL